MGGYAMIVQEFTLDKYDWKVKIYYAVSFYPIENIVGDLVDLECEDEDILIVESSMKDGVMDFASTHSNLLQRKTIMIFGMSSSASEFANSLAHEVGHLASHISIADNINPFGEEIQYLAGDITQQMFDVTERFLCEHCRQKLYK